MLQPVRLLSVPPEGTYHSVSDDVWTGPVRSDDGMELAFIKALPLYKLTREIVCALVASACNLPVLRPAVILLEDTPLAREGNGLASVASPWKKPTQWRTTRFCSPS